MCSFCQTASGANFTPNVRCHKSINALLEMRIVVLQFDKNAFDLNSLSSQRGFLAHIASVHLVHSIKLVVIALELCLDCSGIRR
jgi:hypothetical protein